MTFVKMYRIFGELVTQFGERREGQYILTMIFPNGMEIFVYLYNNSTVIRLQVPEQLS